MAFLIDTNVISEAARADPDSAVVAWLARLRSTEAFLSVLTLGEIRRGVEFLEPGRRKSQLRAWLEQDLAARFRGRILPVDAEVAGTWGTLDAAGRRGGRPLPAIDGLLLATAAANGLTLATRNTADCSGRGVPVLNPWEQGEG